MKFFTLITSLVFVSTLHASDTPHPMDDVTVNKKFVAGNITVVHMDSDNKHYVTNHSLATLTNEQGASLKSLIDSLTAPVAAQAVPGNTPQNTAVPPTSAPVKQPGVSKAAGDGAAQAEESVITDVRAKEILKKDALSVSQKEVTQLVRYLNETLHIEGKDILEATYGKANATKNSKQYWEVLHNTNSKIKTETIKNFLEFAREKLQ